MKLGEDVDLRKLAECTELFTGADLEGLCREAGMAALREDLSASSIHDRHFQAARSSLSPSLTKAVVDEYSTVLNCRHQWINKEETLKRVFLSFIFVFEELVSHEHARSVHPRTMQLLCAWVMKSCMSMTRHGRWPIGNTKLCWTHCSAFFGETIFVALLVKASSSCLHDTIFFRLMSCSACVCPSLIFCTTVWILCPPLTQRVMYVAPIW